ncbi:hypothetical protein KCU77_g2354, partial [Aureobasidium melanogenum]
MFAKFIAGVLSLCGRAQKEELELEPMVWCDSGCAHRHHGQADDALLRAREDERLFKVHGRWCNFKTQAKGWRICLATAVMLEPLENQVRAELTLRAQERCLSREPIQAPEKPQYRDSFKQPNDLVPDWENRMNLPPEDQVSTPGKSAKLRFSSKHLTQKYDVHAPACVIRRAEKEKEPRAVELDPTASLSLGRVHPKARDKRPSAQDVWAKHRHIVDYTRPSHPSQAAQVRSVSYASQSRFFGNW